MRLSRTFGIAAASFAPLAASLATYSPSISDAPAPIFQVGIPPSSSISSTSQGGIYFSISASTSFQWVALGIGQQMSGSTIFVIYTSSDGSNVTVSARDGTGHVQPTFDQTLSQGVTLLAGSGIINNTMVANIHCTTCQLDSAANSASSPWIAAWNEGTALNSDDTQANIARHGPEDMRQFTFDLTQAALTQDTNPFVGSSSTSPSGTVSAPPGASSTSNPSSDSDGDSSSSEETGTGAGKIAKYDKAHGVIMGLVVVILFPLGSIFMRTIRHPWIHGGIQLLSFGLMIAGLGLGVKLAQFTDQLWSNTHTRFGVAIVALFVAQPFLGVMHHYRYQQVQSRTSVSHVHIWYGRVLMILAVVNGGLGLKLAANSRSGEIVYGVLAGVVGVLYIAAVLLRRQGPVGIGSISSRGGSKTELSHRS